MRDFIVIGENIHCSRSIKTSGPRVQAQAILHDGGVLPVPPAIRDGAEWATGKVRPCAVAAWQGLHGDAAGQVAATAFVDGLARSQAAVGARFLDINVDAFSADVPARCAAMRWSACVAQRAATIPLSIDSSHPAVLEAGLAVCDRSRGAPLLNSVSLERQDAIRLAAQYGCAVVASAAGENEIPATAEGRLANLARLFALLQDAGLTGERIFFDPLVLPVGADALQPGVTLATIRGLRAIHGDRVHVTGGFSNVSFGMPQRRLLNEVFIRMALEAGADSGIVDPLLSGPARIAALDPATEPFRLAHAALSGQDEYAAAFLAAARAGRLG